MKISNLLFSIVILLSTFSVGAEEPPNPITQLNWQTGPNTQSIDGKATLKVPENYYFLNEAETDKYLNLTQNPPSGTDSLFTNGSTWEAYLNFEPIGYVKDNETIDADSLLEQYKNSVKLGNDIRKEKGWSALEVEGWFLKPQYDKGQKLLEWAFLLRNADNQQPVVNYYTKILGRTGAVSVILVSSPENMNGSIPDFKEKLASFEFTQGEKYSEFKEGDKVAEYGLAALILGGAAAVASKKGFFAVILAFLAGAWKLLFIPFILLLGWFKSLFTKKN